MAPMIFGKPVLRLDTVVFENFPTHKERMGRVAHLYDFEGQTRVVVNFEDGSQCVFFDFELNVPPARSAS